MVTESTTLQKIKTIRRTVKYLVYGFAVIGIAFLVWRYDLESIPKGYHHLGPQHMPEGTRVISTPCGGGTALGLGSVIRYTPASGNGASTFGVIAGLPGESIAIGKVADGEVALRVGGRPEEIGLPSGHSIPTGEIPVGTFLVLLGDRHLKSGSRHPDSRQLGLISRDWIDAKIISSLYFF